MTSFSCPFKNVGGEMVLCKKCGNLGRVADVRALCPDRPSTINPIVNTPGGGL